MHALVVIVPIPEGTEIESRYAAQVLREAIPLIETKLSLTKGTLRGVLPPYDVKAGWECQDDIELPA